MKTKGSRARRRASYKYKVMLNTDISKDKMPPRPFGCQLDHIVPRCFGFTHAIPPELIGSRENLQWLSMNDNIQKGTRLTVDSIRVLRLWGLDHLADKFEDRVMK